MFDAVDEQGVYWTRRRKRNLRVCRDNWIVLLSSGLVLGALLFLWLQYAILPAARQLRVYRRAVSTACLVKPFVLDPNTTWTVCDESNPAASAAEAAASYCVDVWMDLEWTTSETVTQHALVFFARYRVYPIWDPERQDDVYVLRTLRDVENKAHANTPIQPGSSGWWCSIDPAVEPASTTEQAVYLGKPPKPSDGNLVGYSMLALMLAIVMVPWMVCVVMACVPVIACSWDFRRLRALSEFASIYKAWNATDCTQRYRIPEEDSARVHPFLLGMYRPHVARPSCCTRLWWGTRSKLQPPQQGLSSLVGFRENPVFSRHVLPLIDEFMSASEEAGGFCTAAYRRERDKAALARASLASVAAAAAAAVEIESETKVAPSGGVSDVRPLFMHVRMNFAS